MKKICFCAEIHIPLVQPRYKPYDIIRNNYKAYNPAEERIVKKIASENLLPFLHCLKTINSKSRQKIKIGISISGIALKMLQKYAPEVIGRMAHLTLDNSIEFFSEPWGHSIASYFNNESLEKQVELHDRAMQSYFGEVPQVFFQHSPLYNDDSINTIFSLGKDVIFTNFNQLDEVVSQAFYSDDEEPRKLVFPIDYKTSQFIQNVDFNLLQQNTPYHSRSVVRQFKKSVYDDFPVILNCNLTRTKCFFHLSRSLTWEKLLKEMLVDPEIEFILPSETKKKENFSGWEAYSSEITHRSRIPDLWVKNSFQKKAFEKLLEIDKRVNNGSSDGLADEWSYLQDMDYLYFMNDQFTRKQYAATHYTPYANPGMAYNNYVESLNHFTEKLSTNFSNKPKEITMSKLQFKTA